MPSYFEGCLPGKLTLRLLAFFPLLIFGLNVKNPPKNEIKKIREINWSYLCPQRLNKFSIGSSCNDRKRKPSEFAEICFEKIREITSSELTLWRVLAIWNHCAAGLPTHSVFLALHSGLACMLQPLFFHKRKGLVTLHRCY